MPGLIALKCQWLIEAAWQRIHVYHYVHDSNTRVEIGKPEIGVESGC
jgi:hypothetical protein